jgi:hypothetical protein
MADYAGEADMYCRNGRKQELMMMIRHIRNINIIDK